MIDEIKFEQLCRQVNEQHAFLEQLQKDIKDLSVQLKIIVKQKSKVCDHFELEKDSCAKTSWSSTADMQTYDVEYHKCLSCGKEIPIITLIKKVSL